MDELGVTLVVEDGVGDLVGVGVWLLLGVLVVEELGVTLGVEDGD